MPAWTSPPSGCQPILEEWGFLDDCKSPKTLDELIDIGAQIYTVQRNLLGEFPSREAIKEFFGDALFHDPFFLRLAEKRKRAYLPPIMYETCAHCLAEFIVDTYWREIEV